MSRKMQSEKENMTLMQKRAVLVCILCVLAVLLTFGITTALLKKGGDAPAPSVSESAADPAPGEDLSSHYQIDNASAALLTETADAGADYLNDTLFLGDSNTVRLYNNGLISLQQFCAKEGIGTQAALNEGIVTFKKDSNHYTIPQAVAMMKPRRVVMTFGTNDTGMEVSDFIAHYTALVQAVQQSYPYTDIIVNTVPPVPVDHSNYPHMDQSKIDDFNMALLNMCEQLGVRFLNSAEALKGSDGYGIADYYTSGDIHLKSVGLKAVLNYIRTHACQTDDRRPDTNNIPTRTMEYVSNPSSAVAAPSSEAASSSGSLSESASSSESSSSSESTSSSEGKKFEAHYHVDKNGGGTLSSGSDSGKTALTYDVTNTAQSVSVTAVPQEGHVFVRWSDGVTQKTRTDTNFKQNVDVTAMFAQASISISSTGKAVLGDYYTFTAKLGGKHLTADSIRWYANGAEVPQAAGKTTVKVEIDPSMLNATFKVYAVASYNGCTIASNTVNVTVSGVSAGSASSSGSTSSSSSGSTSSSGSSSAASSGASSGSTSASDSTSHGTSSSESTAPSASTSSSNGESSSSHSTSSSNSSGSSHSTGSSVSSSESTSSSHSSSATESGSHTDSSEANASKETTNEQAAPTDSAS